MFVEKHNSSQQNLKNHILGAITRLEEGPWLDLDTNYTESNQ